MYKEPHHFLYEKSSKRNIPLMIFLLTFEKIQPRELNDYSLLSPGQNIHDSKGPKKPI